MYHSRILRLTVVASLAVSCAGMLACSEDSNPLAAAEEMVGIHAGPNTAITTANAAAAIDSIMSPLGDGIFEVLVMANPDFQEPSRDAAAVTADITPVVLQGADIFYDDDGNSTGSGTMSVTSGSLVTDVNATTGAGTVKLTIEVDLNDFSADGLLFLGGSHESTMTITLGAGGEIAGLIAVIDADIAVAGTLSGALSIDLTITMTGEEDTVAVGTAIVDGTPVAINITDF